MITLKPQTYEALREYAEALIEGCAPFKVDPLKLLVDTDAYPKIVRGVEMVEFICGAFNIIATDIGTPMGPLWGHVSAGLEAPEPKGNRKGKGKAQKAKPKSGLLTQPPPPKSKPAPRTPRMEPLPPGRVEARAVTEIDAWGHTRVVGGHGGSVGRPAALPSGTTPGLAMPPGGYDRGPAPPAPAKRGKAPKPPKAPKPAKPPRSTRKSRIAAVQPGLGI